MKLLSFIRNNESQIGIQTERGILDLSAAVALKGGFDLPLDLMKLIAKGAAGVASLNQWLSANSDLPESVYLAEGDVTFGACVPNPQKIICVGLNYRRHAEESNMPVPTLPILFNKFNNTLTGHKADVAIPAATKAADYEAELTVVIGKKAQNVSEEDALDYVYGYCNANDLSARDLQFRTHQWLLGKTCDDFSPLGPYLVTADEVGDPQNLWIRTHVNGVMKQNSNTADMVFNVKEIVSYISKHFTLEPGDVIMTGTPEGVVWGLPENERVYLKPGDEIIVEIEKLGKLYNRMVAPKA